MFMNGRLNIVKNVKYSTNWYTLYVSGSVVSDSATPWIVALQSLPSMEFSRQEYWSGLPFSTPEDLLNPGIEPASLVSPAFAGVFFPPAPKMSSTPQIDTVV